MINGKLEFTRDGFKEYRTLEAQLAFYQKQLSELRDNYLIVDTVNDYRSGQASYCHDRDGPADGLRTFQGSGRECNFRSHSKNMDYQKDCRSIHGLYRGGSSGCCGNVRLSRNRIGQDRTPPVRFAPYCQQVY